MTKYAIGLRGKSDKYHKVADNVCETLLNNLQDNHVYISTYQHESLDEMLAIYKPINKAIVSDTSDGSWYQGFHMTCLHTINILQMIKTSGNTYEWIVITRLDTRFNQCLSELLPSDPSKIYALCKCEKEPLIDDNLWIFTPDKIDMIIASLQYILSHRLMTHDLKRVYEKLSGNHDAFAYIFPGEFYLCEERPLMTFTRELE